MQLEKAWNNVDTLTGKASDLTRQLAFAGIAVVWVFKNSTQAAIVPNDFVVALFLLVITLAFDFLQYAVGGVVWRVFLSRQLNKHAGSNKDDEVDDAPGWINRPANLFFYGKLALIVLSYGALIHGVGARL